MPMLCLRLLLLLNAAQGNWMGMKSSTGLNSRFMGIKSPTGVRKPLIISKASLDKMQQGLKFGDKKLVVITGTSSGLGKKTAKALLRTNKYHVIGAVRDMVKMNVVAEMEGFNMDHFTAMHLELASFKSVNNFVEELEKFRGDHPIDRLACNSAVYQPTLGYPKWTEDEHEQQLQINFLSHFLLISLVMPMMKDSEDPRVCMVGSVTGNDNTVGGGGVYPVADLKDLEGLELGCKKPIAMMDGYNFNGAKAYKDTKMALMMTSIALHERFHRSTGIAFSSIYPGCIAESPLFREKRPWFRKLFPVFMKYITGGFVGEEEAGQRLFQVLHDPNCYPKSGIYWGWNGGAREGRGLEAMEKGGQIVGAGGAGGGWESIFENDPSDKVLNQDLMRKLFEYTTEVTGAKWPKSYAAKPASKKDEASIKSIVDALVDDGAHMKESTEFLEQIYHALDPSPNDPSNSEELYKQLRRALGEEKEHAPVTGASRKDKEPALAAAGTSTKKKGAGWLDMFRQKAK